MKLNVLKEQQSERKEDVLISLPPTLLAGVARGCTYQPLIHLFENWIKKLQYIGYIHCSE